MALQRILVIDELVPMPDSSSGGRRQFEILKLLRSDGHAVAFMPHAVKAGTEHYLDDLRAVGIHVTAPSGGTAVEPAGFRQTFATAEFDTVIIAFHTLAQRYLGMVRELFPRARVIIDTVDLHFVREERRAARSTDPALARAAADTRRAELGIYAKADALWAITPVERDILLRELPGASVSVVPNVHDVVACPMPFAEREGLLFVGNFWHPPNAEGIAWFLTEVLPLIWAQDATIPVRIVGANLREEVRAFAPPGVSMLGWVHDIEPLLASSRLSISPLLHGAGMKGKVGEALAHGLPVVTTDIGAEGIGLVDGTNALIADDAAAFAAAVLRAYNDPELWSTLAQGGQSLVATSYTPECVMVLVRAALGHNPAPLHYAAVPDWNDAASVKRVVDWYIRAHDHNRTASLLLGLTDVRADAAFAMLAQWITELGYDLDAIPDIQIADVTSADLAVLPNDTTWIPLSSTVARPVHLTHVLTLDGDPVTL